MTHRWRFAWAWTIAVVLGAGCSSAPTPPPGPPSPPPPGPTCPELGVPWCHEAGMSCGECKHQPPGEACPVKAPSCEAPPVPPAPPSPDACNPELSAALSAPPADDGLWRDVGGEATRTSAVAAAIRAAQAACPSAWRAHCLAGGPAYIDAGYRLIAAQLQRGGVAASQGVTASGERKDHLFVLRAANVWEEWKLFAYADGCLAQSQYRSGHQFLGDVPAPPPTTGACPVSPCPEPVWTTATLPDGWGSDEIGRPRWQFNSSVYVGRYLDNTAVVIRNEPYCASIGMSPYADGQPRASCPVRPDGHRDREAVELHLTGGFVLEARAGATCTPHPTNRVMFEIGTGNCRLCSVNRYRSKTAGAPDEPVCSEWR